MAEETIKFGLDGIGHQLSDRRIRVPLYQRSYAWTSEQLDDFIADLRNAFNGTVREHFLGTVVLSDDDGDYVTVIDGQQRLATTALAYCALRDYYAQNGQDRRASEINSEYLNSYNDGDDSDEPRLQLNAEDDEFFRQYVVSTVGSVMSTRDSHGLIAAAYTQLSNFVADEAKNAGTGWVHRLVDWRKFLHEGVRVIFVSVPNESDAFLIFETLNDRGADLTLADLLKNYLFGLAAKTVGGLDQVRDRWLLALGAMDTNQDLYVAFLRQFWSSKHGATRERELYKKIKSEVTTPQQAITFATELRNAAGIYAALLSSAADYWSKWGTGARKNIETLNRLALGQNRPMLLAVLQHFSREEAKKVLRLAVAWGVRGLVVGGIGGGSMERAYCEAAIKVRSGAIKTALELADELSEYIATDEEFESSFTLLRVPQTKSYLSRYYLLALERSARGEDEPELVANADEGEINLEHIYPKKPIAEQWVTFDPDSLPLWRDRLGNQSLMKGSPNGKEGNNPFSTKKLAYRESELVLTREVGHLADWTPEAVVRRQARLAKLAVRVWPRS